MAIAGIPMAAILEVMEGVIIDEKEAEPDARANGPERPWLILNVRQRKTHVWKLSWTRKPVAVRRQAIAGRKEEVDRGVATHVLALPRFVGIFTMVGVGCITFFALFMPAWEFTPGVPSRCVFGLAQLGVTYLLAEFVAFGFSKRVIAERISSALRKNEKTA